MDGADFFGVSAGQGEMPEISRDEDAAELGEHVCGRRAGLGRVTGGAGAVSLDVGGVVPGRGVPAGGDGLAGELERDGALGPGPKTPYHRQVAAAAWMVAVFP
jgi:hypothetical protein